MPDVTDHVGRFIVEPLGAPSNRLGVRAVDRLLQTFQKLPLTFEIPIAPLQSLCPLTRRPAMDFLDQPRERALGGLIAQPRLGVR